MSMIQTRANVIHSKTSRNTCKVTILSITRSSFSTKNLSGLPDAWKPRFAPFCRRFHVIFVRSLVAVDGSATFGETANAA